jgi:hypothetical protein
VPPHRFIVGSAQALQKGSRSGVDIPTGARANVGLEFG